MTAKAKDKLYDKINEAMILYNDISNENNPSLFKSKIFKCVSIIKNVVDQLDLVDYLLLDNHPIPTHKEYRDLYFKLGTLYKSYADIQLSEDSDKTLVVAFYKKAIDCYNHIYRFCFKDMNSSIQLVSIYTHLCLIYESDTDTCIKYLNEALIYCSDSPTIHYNLGFLYQRANLLELSVVHYTMAINFAQLTSSGYDDTQDDRNRILVDSYNGLSCVYSSVKNWPTSLYYLRLAEAIQPQKPEILNQLGVVYTEMRRTDLAEKAYTRALENCKKPSLLADIYLNFGHMHSYNGDNLKAVECYNHSLTHAPTFSLPFQNKLMNLSYLFDQFDDKMYILRQHKLINKIYNTYDMQNKITFHFDKSFYRTDNNKIRIGIVSGDFVEHPVSHFIGTFLKNYDSSRFEVTCYSECMLDVRSFNKDIRLKFLRNQSARSAAELIYDDKIHILFDLSGHTAHNRLDVFALKPSPIQITYIGYPYSTGLTTMDYRITDRFCDNDVISQPFYTERLLYLPDCFLCYELPSTLPTLTTSQPYLESPLLRIGCFNRLNKITDGVVDVFNTLLLRNNRVSFVFKTKALLNKIVKARFLEKFHRSVRDRITIYDCTNTHGEHLLMYNKIDIAIDTFPYSGTTTSCEALMMGVPVFTFYDTTNYFHAQNVTASILYNSDMEDYVITGGVDDLDRSVKKIMSYKNTNVDFWKTLKETTRNKFINGRVCDKQNYMTCLTDMLINLYHQKQNHQVQTDHQ